MTSAAPRYMFAASSDQGYVRSNNEDRVYCDDVRGFFVVVDGMGGHQAGERAADIAVERIRARLERQTDTTEQRIREAITLANNAIYEAARRSPDLNGMACVLTVAVVEEAHVTIGHVGDSRLYQIKRGHIEKITHDHSPVGEREDRGEISEAEAMQHPRRNEVYRDVGSQEHTPHDEDFIEILMIAFEPDSALLLCSDGLSDALSSKTILEMIQQNAGDRWATVRALIAEANEHGKDNVSAILVEGAQFAAAFGKPAVRTRRNVIITDPSGETTDRMRPMQMLPARVPWYSGRPAMLVYGVIAGVLLLFAVQRLKPAPPQPPHVPQVLSVNAPDAIDATIASAQPGDTVSVGNGIYRETIHLKTGVAVIASTPRAAIIEGSVDAADVQKARFEGFQVRGGEVGIRVTSSDVELLRDEVSGTRGSGVVFSGTSRGEVIACSIHNNAGAGIVVNASAAPVIEQNLIAANGTEPGKAAPGLLIEAGGAPRVVGNMFASNGAEAIWLPHPDDAMVQENFFSVSGKPDRRPKIRVVAGQGLGSQDRSPAPPVSPPHIRRQP